MNRLMVRSSMQLSTMHASLRAQGNREIDSRAKAPPSSLIPNVLLNKKGNDIARKHKKESREGNKGRSVETSTIIFVTLCGTAFSKRAICASRRPLLKSYLHNQQQIPNWVKPRERVESLKFVPDANAQAMSTPTAPALEVDTIIEIT
ncbi:hypothetical protein BDP55DRAFT_405885 [Colletotrichum godetiae]|uniref:Uncharacterized protein n=1 Tax=Colletotrichum godetiae TaxID=1209918 RepID=A0AAJ0AUP1_9PEZI|nr:uncharacterized protein BDP55DRAFT_405885 [Colletotrichum godetiae]KAK1689311.1 hypothetical protein BDP55DRAFT_405885 [Colletotrichum godetiae]